MLNSAEHANLIKEREDLFALFNNKVEKRIFQAEFPQKVLVAWKDTGAIFETMEFYCKGLEGYE